MEDLAQRKGRGFLRDAVDAYMSGNGDIRGKCGASIGDNDYLSRMERTVFQQELPAMHSAQWGNPDYDGLLKTALESIAHQLERDLGRNERENNYITDDTARDLRAAVRQLEQCGVSGGSAGGSIERLAWFVGGDPAKIRQLQSKWTNISTGIKTTKNGQRFSNIVPTGSSNPLFRADLHPYQGNPSYYHINVRAANEASVWQRSLASKLKHMEISKEAYEMLKDFQHTAKVVKVAGRIFLIAGAALDALELRLAELLVE